MLGRGGMGAVYLAHDTQLDRQVALKVPHREFAQDREVRERFLREARAAARFHHPNFCPIHDIGEVDGIPYLTMAYIEGGTLASTIERDQPWDQRQGGRGRPATWPWPWPRRTARGSSTATSSRPTS